MTNVNRNGTVTFSFYRPEVSAVKIVGDFTGWLADPIEMTSAGNGWWTLGKSLRGGEYRFRYLADGEQFADYASHGIEATKSGWNSVLVVPNAA